MHYISPFFLACGISHFTSNAGPFPTFRSSGGLVITPSWMAIMAGLKVASAITLVYRTYLIRNTKPTAATVKEPSCIHSDGVKQMFILLRMRQEVESGNGERTTRLAAGPFKPDFGLSGTVPLLDKVFPPLVSTPAGFRILKAEGLQPRWLSQQMQRPRAMPGALQYEQQRLST